MSNSLERVMKMSGEGFSNYEEASLRKIYSNESKEVQDQIITNHRMVGGSIALFLKSKSASQIKNEFERERKKLLEKKEGDTSLGLKSLKESYGLKMFNAFKQDPLYEAIAVMKKTAPDIDTIVMKIFAAGDLSSEEAHEPIVQIREICAKDAKWLTSHPEELMDRLTSIMAITQHMLKS